MVDFAILRQLRHELRTCYGRLVFDRLHSHATLDLMLSVDADGTVTQAHEFLEPELLNRGCYGTAAESWALPAPTDGQPGRVTLRVELTTRAWDHDLHH